MTPSIPEFPGRPPEHQLKAQHLVRDIARPTGNAALYASASKQISVSVPLRSLAPVEVLADRAGESRGSMVVTLIAMALDLVFAEMPPDLRAEVDAEIEARESELYSQLDPQEGS